MDSSDSSSSAVAAPEAAQPLNLDVSIDKVSTCQRRVKVTIPRADIVRYQDEALGELVPTALLPGFRRGGRRGGSSAAASSRSCLTRFVPSC